MNMFDELEKRENTAPLERIARKALAAYGMDEARLDVVSHADHALFRVTDRLASVDATKVRYGLRIHPRGWSRNQILRTLLWLSALRREVTVPEPILTRAGELVQSLSTRGVSGFRQVTLLGWLDGRRLDANDWTQEQVRDAGRMLGTFHGHAVRFRLPEDLVPPHRDADTLRETIDPAGLSHALGLEEETLFVEAVGRVREAMFALGTAPNVAGMIHGRLTPEHVVFEEDGARAVGFTGARWGYYAYDLATLDLDLRTQENVDSLRDGLLEGYGETCPLSSEFIDHIDAFAILRLLDKLASLASSLKSGAPDVDQRSIGRTTEMLRRILTDVAPFEAEKEERADSL